MPRIVFIHPGGARQNVEAPEGASVLEAAHAAGIDALEGACEGCMACSTCHVIAADPWFEKLPPASDEERDILDLAWGLERASRLGCQLRVTPALDGMELRIPARHHNALAG